ncbi:GAP family protein [Leifsonia poae]|uniref:GAP family protein n=1 Tax=Leifsonia poae TaxID=110933 RepID=UPI001CBADDD1|nr:GAP family protein [Leifsonia poae]
MGPLIVSLLPLAFGIALSPLAIMALVAVLLSRHGRTNGIAFLIGWVVAVVAVLAVSLWIFALVEVHARAQPPLWVPLVRLVLGLFLLLAAIVVYRRGSARNRQMAQAVTPADVVQAAPQLPGWLNAVESFKPGRSALLGFGIFVLNPVDASCAILAALDLQLASISTGAMVTTAIVFAVVGVLPIAVPVLFTLIRGEKAQPLLTASRGWIATHTNVLNAALLLVIAVLQLQKGLSTLLAY